MYDPIIYLKTEKVNKFQRHVFIYLKCRKVDPLFSSKPCSTWVWLKLAASRDSVVSRNVYLSVVNKYNTCNSHVNGVTCHYNTSQCNTYTSPSLTMSVPDFQQTFSNQFNICYWQEEFEDTKGVIRISISKKNRQHNRQKKKDKRTNNDLQNIHIKLKIE